METRPAEEQCERSQEASAYVLGELAGAALDDYARHLSTCAICTQEVELLESVADAVPLLATRPPTRQQPPVREDSNRAFDPEPEPVLRRPPRLEAIEGGAAPRTSGRGRRPFARGPVSRSMTIGFMAIVVIGIVTVLLTRESASIHYLPAKAGWAEGGAVVEIQGSQASLLVKGMPAPAQGKRYEVWVIYKGTIAAAPTGAFIDLNNNGEADVSVPGDIDDAIALAVYVEPSGGPQTTKSGAVAVADLRSVTEVSGS